MRPVIFLLISLLLILTACQENIQIPDKTDLTGSWQFRKQSDSLWMDANIPGTVQTDLYANQLIEDPYFSDNELKNKWIENENWLYRKNFFISEHQKHSHAELVFEGLDTYASVFLNDVKILVAENMFQSHKISIDKLLKTGENKLEILFESPVKKAIPIHDSLTYRLPADNDRNDKQTSVFTRKAPYQYGWDWGPRYVTMGIWRPVYIQYWKGIEVQENRLYQKALSDSLALVGWEAEVFSEIETTLECSVFHENNKLFNQVFKLKKGFNHFKESFSIKNPKRWWPNGFGDPSLYSFKIELKTRNQSLSTFKKIGFRTIDFITEKDSIGESFYFKVNGFPVYAKGANYIPQDNFLAEVDSIRYKQLIKSVKEANMNMLRIWGGGIYENDIFYNLCDENGILIWQDFMFACSLYPADTVFLHNVEKEARQNIKRLRDHPSLALWCGNNEMNELWFNWGYQKKFAYSKSDSLKIWMDYQLVFNQLLPDLVKELDPKTAYWESSPKIGWGHPQSLTHGDSHYWGVWWGKEAFETYEKKIPRFASEFGFQSFPQMSTLLAFADSHEMHLHSKSINAHQKSSIGNQNILEYMARDFKVPKDFEDFSYVSQLLQAYGLSKAFEAQRRTKPKCMGTLYWQLNDCWPGISWSGMDYFGNWKALHYEAKNDFKTFLISFEERKEGLEIFIVSDSLRKIEARLELKLMDFYGNEIYYNSSLHSIQANGSETTFKISSTTLKKVLDRTKILLSARLFQKDKLLAENIYYFKRPKDLALPNNPEIKFKTEGNHLIIWSESGELVKNLYLKTPKNIHFSKNFFDILPKEVISLNYENGSPEDLLSLEFKCLNSIK
jgi:beta-mannosidase